MDVQQGGWYFSSEHGELCQVIERLTLWGEDICRVWLSQSNMVVRLPARDLRPAQTVGKVTTDNIIYTAAAAKVADAMERTRPGGSVMLLAPLSAEMIPLPHQLQALSRATRGDYVRYLLADEVGLGKTIEAGLIMREFKIRGLVKRTLIVVPKSLVVQWQAEMKNRFHENFRIVLGDDIDSLEHIARTDASDPSPWELFDQVIVSLDSVKPIRHRGNWSRERIQVYNKNRFEELCAAGWDLIIVDEAHKLSGSDEGVARFKLGKALSDAAPLLLLLSATPHQGKSDAFYRLMFLLDPLTFAEKMTIRREKIAPFVIRTEKRKAIDEQGNPLFMPRTTQLVPIQWQERHTLQHQLYDEVSAYVRFGYNQALKTKKRYFGFLMLLLQRLISSSTRAIRKTLDTRYLLLKNAQERLTMAHTNALELENEEETAETFYEMDGEELLEILLDIDLDALDNEIEQVERLRTLAASAEAANPDAKAEVLLEYLHRIQAEEHNPDTKFLIFTEFIQTQLMLKEFLEARGFSVVVLNGAMNMDERLEVQGAFANEVPIMVSTDAGGEGLNLQFCHIVINYDLPWNPMRIEQRIGRVDRIGQSNPVRAFNFIFENSVEFRVRRVLEQKLATILQEFGVDKVSDVLDSSKAGALFQKAFTNAIIEPQKADSAAQQAIADFRKIAHETIVNSPLYGLSATPDPQISKNIKAAPLPFWIEQMTLSWLQLHGGAAQKKDDYWQIIWPDGKKDYPCTFYQNQQKTDTHCVLLSPEDARIRQMLSQGVFFAPTSPIPRIWLKSLPSNIQGLWALCEVQLHIAAIHKTSYLRIPAVRRDFFTIFLSNEGTIFLPTAQHIWDVLLSEPPQIHGYIEGHDAEDLWQSTWNALEKSGNDHYQMLIRAHKESMEQEEKRANIAFSARKKAIEALGLPEVRKYRLARLEEEMTQWRREFERAAQAIPEMKPLLIMKIEEEDS
jgi:SNF2 family DNA or RNA helicase